jgi:hydroxymethylpyrimidine pyrophosphatase-like HAD family hydrolase
MQSYEGLLFDIDGTLVKEGELTVSSPSVVSAFLERRQDAYVAAATARTVDFVMPLMRQLRILHDSVIANGAQIINSQNGETLWRTDISTVQMAGVLAVSRQFDYRFCIAGDPIGGSALTAADCRPRAAVGAYMFDMPHHEAIALKEEIASVKDVYAHISESWVNGAALYDVDICHVDGRKDKAIQRALSNHGVQPKEVMGVGDSLNDIWLFQAVGHRVAVATAHPELIAMADEVIPGYEDDGMTVLLSRLV